MLRNRFINSSFYIWNRENDLQASVIYHHYGQPLLHQSQVLKSLHFTISIKTTLTTRKEYLDNKSLNFPTRIILNQKTITYSLRNGEKQQQHWVMKVSRHHFRHHVIEIYYPDDASFRSGWGLFWWDKWYALVCLIRCCLICSRGFCWMIWWNMF